MTGKVSIHGLKLSFELVLLKLPAGGDPPAREVLRRLSAARINLTCVVLDGGEPGVAGTCCIDAEDRPLVERILVQCPGVMAQSETVGTLTVFPHRYQLDLLAAILRSLVRENIPLAGIASSLSALTFILPYKQLDQAAAAVCRVAQLPANHAPFRPQFRVKQV